MQQIFCLLRRRRENQKFDVYLCNKFFVFYVEDVKIKKFDVAIPMQQCFCLLRRRREY